MADLVAYNEKHNDANGEHNRDGVDDNLSWNCGAEGPSTDPGVEALRARQIRNFAAVLMLSQGVPMFVMGDEVRRSQGGNNNVWCQDNPTGWFDWSAPDRETDLLRFWSRLIAFRRRHAPLRQRRYMNGARNERGLPDLSWHGVEVDAPDLSPGSRSIAFTLGGDADEPDIHVIANMYWEPLVFALPQVPGTALDARDRHRARRTGRYRCGEMMPRTLGHPAKRRGEASSFLSVVEVDRLRAGTG